MKCSARIAASLFAMVATASCTSSAPPLDIGVGDPTAATSTDHRRRCPLSPLRRRQPLPQAAEPAGVMPQGDGGPVAAISTAIAHPVRPDRRLDRAGRDAAHPGTRQALWRTRHRPRRGRRRRRDAYPERLFLGDVRGWIDDRDLCLGRARSRAATGCIASRARPRRKAAAKAGPPCRPPSCRRSPTARSMISPNGCQPARADRRLPANQFFGLPRRLATTPLAIAA